MKRRDLLRRFAAKGWYHKRDDGSHEIITNGRDIEAIPRHREINEKLAHALIKKWDL